MNKSNSFTHLKDLSDALVGLIAGTATNLVSVSSGRSRSSGFVWRQGLIITADQTLSEDGELTVKLWNGDAVATQLVGRDPSTDIALLGLDRPDLQPISLTASAVDVGALVMAVGAEDGQPTAALGVVSRNAGPWRSLRGGEIDARIELNLRLRESAQGGLEPAGPAALAGLQESDVLLSLDDIAVTGTDDLVRLLGAERIGCETSVSFMRDGGLERTSLRPIERGR